MSTVAQYCDEDELRRALPLDASTPTATFADLISEVSSGFTAVLGFEYGGPARRVLLNGSGLERLMLPRPGAGGGPLGVVEENGAVLDPALFELEPELGRYVLRLDAVGKPAAWPLGIRTIVVNYAPAQAPPIVRSLCKVECVRLYRGRQAGHARVIGTPGVSQLVYSSGFEPSTIEMLERIRFEVGNGGPGWVSC